MRKVNFLNGFSTKMVLAVSLVAGLSLTGCEEETLDVTVPDITVTVPEVKVEPGVAYLTLSATLENGGTVSGVEFINAADNSAIAASTSYTEAKELTVIASKDGYESVIKTISIPKVADNNVIMLPVNFVMMPVARGSEAVIDEDKAVASEEPYVPEDQTFNVADLEKDGDWYFVNLVVPTGSYYTEEQVAALLAEVEKIEKLEAGVGTKALSDEELAELETVKASLKAKINGLNTKPATTKIRFPFQLTEAAETVTFSIKADVLIAPVTIKAWLEDTADKRGAKVNGEASLIKEVTLDNVAAEGVVIDHTHGHGHGNDGNAGGGTAAGE